MSGPAPAELSASTIIERIGQGAYPREVLETIARGFLPLSQDDIIPVLAYLTVYGDADIAALARASLADLPLRIIHGFAANEAMPPLHLGLLVQATEDASTLEALIRNRSVPDEAIATLAGRADAGVQEIIVINHARILRAPHILEALLGNPRLSAEARRRALEVREEYFEKQARRDAARVVDEDEADLDLPVDPIADLLEKAAQQEQERSADRPPDLPDADKADEKKMSIFAKILLMGISEKVKLAFRGGKTERTILVRDHNRLICSAVMRNPRLTESEVESIAGMKGVEEEVLRLIGIRRDWAAKYNIAFTLVRNPKAPIGVVLPLINRLTLRDLKGLKDDKNVSEVVRATARKLYAQRSLKS